MVNAAGEPPAGDAARERPDRGEVAIPRRWAVDPAVRGAAARLIDENRFGLTSWLAEAAGAAPDTVRALRLVAYGDALRVAVGACASRFGDLAGELRLRDVEDRHVRILVFTAAVRAALLAPHSAAPELLRELLPAVADQPDLSAIGAIIRDSALRGVQLVNASGAAMAGVAKLETEIADAVEQAAELLKAGPKRTIKFAAATAIWQDWISATGPLGSLLATVAADNRDARRGVDTEVLDLRNPKKLDRLIEQTDRRSRGRGSRAPIIAGARARLVERATEVADHVAGWSQAVGRLEGFRAAARDAAWQQAPVAGLRDQVRPHKDGVVAALGALAAQASADDPLCTAALRAAGRSLAASFGLFDGQALDGDEPPVEQVINRELLKVADVALDGLRPRGVIPVEAVLAAVDGDDWEAAFDARAARGDHAATRLIIDVIEENDPRLAATLRRRREDTRSRDEEEFQRAVKAINERMARERRQGFVDDDEWSDLTTRLAAMTSRDRDDFGLLRAQLDELTADLTAAGERATDLARKRLADLRNVSPAVSAVADRIDTLIQRGHLATADEFLALAESGEDLPSADDAGDAGGGAGPDPVAELSAIVAALAAEPLTLAAARAAAAGDAWTPAVTFSSLAPDRRRKAADAIEAWIAHRDGPRSNRNVEALRTVLAATGIDADNPRRSNDVRPSDIRSGDRVWMNLTGVRRLGSALVPTFGTMSGGDRGELLRMLLVWGRPSAAALFEMIAQDGSGQPVLVLYFGLLPAAERRALSELARRRTHAAAVVDDAVLAYLASRPESTFDALMGAVLPFTAINPYNPRVAGRVPVEMFYGRTDEIHEIIDRQGTSFLYGGRQLGKSSLLRAAARQFDDGVTRRVLYLDLQREGIGRTRRPTDLWDVLWDRLATMGIVRGRRPAPRELADRVVSGVRTWLDARDDRRMLLLLDECDDFLEADAAEQFPTVVRIKGLLEETNQRCKPVFAGLHQVQRFEHIPNQPLAHLGRPLSIGPLRPKAAFDLLDRPMRALGYRFESNELVNRVLAYCNNQPSLIQLFGDALVQQLLRAPVGPDAPPHMITEDDVESAYASRDLTEDFRHRFELTLQLDLRYKVIAYAMAHRAHEAGPATVADPARLRADCEQWWPRGFAGIPGDEFRGLLGEMVGLGVLSEVDSGFRMRSPNVLRTLGTADQIEDRLLDTENYPVPEPFQAASFRRALPTTGRRAPLNEAQLAQILERRNQPLVIAGSPALGLGDVIEAVRDCDKRTYSVSETVVNGDRISAGSIRPVPGKHRLVLADMAGLDTEGAQAAIESARDALARTTGETVAVVALTDPRHALLWPSLSTDGQGTAETVRVIGLRRWDLTGLRMWMHDTDLPFQADDAQRGLLAATGGWPLLIDRVVETLNSGRTPPRSALDALAAHLADEHGAVEFVTATGLLAQPIIRRAFGVLVDYDEPAFGEDLADLLADELGAELIGRVEPAGLGTPDRRAALRVLETLRLLAVLPMSDGRLTVEPVLAAVWRTMHAAAAHPR
ncbi:hypothetical protein ND748_15385 [Frankia sp. AiPs1]|uniref:hypothetical protein n=1 Tax=Frankia sp. AiPs1 TaxID=573493 RepID=UPI0020434230|nr:hypothetical protein [Frankia sp. AiPs1]MCM3923039.1 hypothetical protein [Frankia sp. AiPs1]